MTNASLVTLRMYSNKIICAEATQYIVEVLQKITLIATSLCEKNIQSLQEEVIKSREHRGCQTKLKIIYSLL